MAQTAAISLTSKMVADTLFLHLYFKAERGGCGGTLPTEMLAASFALGQFSVLHLRQTRTIQGRR
jgi:hypothetical protein